ncbi:MAG: acyl-CoA dehydrogenase family protein [Pseudomonadales bacterium]|jgi:alkylation response protein AidB-like acyl-CoA dehydrogenase|nr:acyl-CoA dehydrogenase family protein [Pseudomonadales bacterium]
MNFDLSEEQQLIQDSVARFVADNYELEKRRKQSAEDPGYSEDHWKTFAELGWLALPFAEEDGGIGGDAIDVMVVMEQFGKGLVLEPFFATVVLGGGVLKRTLEGERRAELIGGIVAGTHKFTLAHTEEQSRWDLDDVTTSAREDGDAFVLNGGKSVVLAAHTADGIIVSARTSGGQMDPNGISLFLVDPKAEGVKVESYPTIDGQRAAELTLTDVRVSASDLLGQMDGGYAVLRAVANEATLALCAEALGGLERLYKDTVQYTQEREQFDHPLADFQSLQHRMVEMFMEYEQCKSMVLRATMEYVQNGDAAERTISGCKHLIGEAGKFISENAVQLHGGMGVTEELALGHYFMRQFAIENQFGNADWHLERFAA